MHPSKKQFEKKKIEKKIYIYIFSGMAHQKIRLMNVHKFSLVLKMIKIITCVLGGVWAGPALGSCERSCNRLG
jgi:hypothetical protein